MADQNQGSTPPDPFEMFRRLWAPLGLPVPGMAMPTLDPAEVEKRITDLKSVETWLGINLNMVKMAIQGLEVQKMALNAMQANAGAAGDAAKAFASMMPPAAAASLATGPGSGPASGPASNAANPLANPMLWPWAMMQGAADQGAAAAKPPASRPKDGAKVGKNRKDGT